MTHSAERRATRARMLPQRLRYSCEGDTRPCTGALVAAISTPLGRLALHVRQSATTARKQQVQTTRATC